MFLKLFVLFTCVLVIETVLLVQVHALVGFFGTLAIILATALLASWLVRREGLKTAQRLRGELGSGRVPSEPLVEGVLILIAGAVLMTPGLLTDCCGFLLLVPAVRSRVARQVIATTKVSMEQKATKFRQSIVGQFAVGDPGKPHPGEVIDVDYERVPNERR